MNSKFTISVLMPVYNCEAYLDEAIRSIREQTFTDFEFVIVNDGSTDRSLEIIEQHAAEDPRIVVLDRPNGGIVDALNAGLEVCRGEFIARMDGDDFSMPTRFEKQVDFLRSHQDYGGVGGRVIQLLPSGETLQSDKCLLSAAEIHNALSTGQYAILHPTLMVRTHLLRSLNGYRNEFRCAEDLDLLLRLTEQAKLANLDTTVLRYRKGPASMSINLQHDYPYYDFQAVLSAKKRGRLVRRSALARLADRVSWSALTAGHYSRAACFAAYAWWLNPVSAKSWRALARPFLPGQCRRRLQSNVRHLHSA